MPKAYSYIRFSTPEQASGDSLRRQTEAARQFIERHPELELVLTEPDTFRDEGRSGYRTGKGGHTTDGLNTEQQALKDFLSLVERGDIEKGSYLLIENFDRLSRQSPYRTQRLLGTLVDAGIKVVTLHDEKVFDQDTLDGAEGTWLLLQSIMTMHRAHDESVAKGRRMREAWGMKRRLAATKNILMTRRVPFWLTEDRKEIPKQVEVVRRIFERCAEGYGPTSIARELNAEGIEAAQGGRWHESSLKKLLTSPTVLGTLPGTDGKEEIPNYYPSIVSDELWIAAQRYALGFGTARQKRQVGEPHLLSGLMHCSCGATLVRATRTGRVRKDGTRNRWDYLVCSDARVAAGTCKFVGVPYKVAVDAVDVALDNLSEPLAWGGKTEIEAAEENLQSAAAAAEEAYQAWTVTKTTVARQRLKDAESALQEARLAKESAIREWGSVGYRVTLDALNRYFSGQRDNATLRLVVKRVVLDPHANELVLVGHGEATVRGTLYQEDEKRTVSTL